MFVATDGARSTRSRSSIAPIPARGDSAAVLELHCYAVRPTTCSAVASGLRDELAALVPGAGARCVIESHPCRATTSPRCTWACSSAPTGVASGHPRLWFAGDWVALPIPAMLMEAAHTSARLAVNRICEAEGREGFPVWTVPRRGLLARRTA
ncbi:MAG: hypothetical protein U0168_14645 [Nannocystaceae bacterium]